MTRSMPGLREKAQLSSLEKDFPPANPCGEVMLLLLHGVDVSAKARVRRWR